MPADNITPDSGRHIDAAGNVTYDFDAHLHARGLDLDATTGANPPAENRVRWLSTADGALVADIAGWLNSPTDHAAELRAQNPTGNTAGIAVRADDAGHTKVVAYADTGGFVGVTVIDEDDHSDFVRPADLPDLTIAGSLLGPFTASFNPLGALSVDSVDVVHGAGAEIVVLGSVRDWGNANGVTWSAAQEDPDTVRIWARNHLGAAALFDLDFIVLAL